MMNSLSILLFASFPLACFGWNSCPQSVPTISVVSRCPANAKEWMSAAENKNCDALKKHQNCSEDGSFVYHCVLNTEATQLIEVCSPPWYMAGYCARFSISEKRLINDPRMDCTKYMLPCPRRFLSNESYKYQTCYAGIDKTTTLHCDKKEATITTLITLLAVFGAVIISLMICLFLWKKIYPKAKPTTGNEDPHMKESQKTDGEGKAKTSFGLDNEDPLQQPFLNKNGVRSEDEAQKPGTSEEHRPPVKDIGSLRKILSKYLEIPCLWIVDKDTGIFYNDETEIEFSKQKYSFLIGNENRALKTKSIDRTGCSHMTDLDELFGLMKNKLPNNPKEKIVCSRCELRLDIEESLQMCDLSKDEDTFFGVVRTKNKLTKDMCDFDLSNTDSD
uniref:Uncharacterized protein LOC111122631 isoform X2 n=1 Tax=Crassostrea virginica TaxID=6565 RepID=A0A8B8CY45_CRAVI|nr:uncharacterized protein LOC111122631 isoform X2 [Crassostrea virginica]